MSSGRVSFFCLGCLWDSERPPPGFPPGGQSSPRFTAAFPYNSPLTEMVPDMKRTFRKTASLAVASVFAAALALPGLVQAQEKPQGGDAPKMEKKAPAPMKKAPAKAAAKKAGSPEVMALQEALRKAGENPGAADGKLGPKTRAALRAFQKKNKLKVTGRADKPTLAKLEPFMTK